MGRLVLRTSQSGSGLLQASDFTYLGKFYLNDSPGYEQGMALRRVAGQARLMVKYYQSNPLIEYAVPASFETTITSSDRVNQWDVISQMSVNGRCFLSWDWAQSRLCISQSQDYDAYVGNLQSCTLTEGASTITNPKKFTLEGINDRMCVNGIVNVPAEFQSAYGFEPYIVAGGGYHSRYAQFPTSMGWSCFAIPDYVPYLASSPSNPDESTSGAVIPASIFRTAALHNTPTNRGVVGNYGYVATPDGTTNDDYPLYPNLNIDMGATGITNYTYTASHSSGAIGPLVWWDGGDPRQNPGSGDNPVGKPKFLPRTGPTGSSPGSPYFNFVVPFTFDKMHWPAGTAFPFPWGNIYAGGAFLYGTKRGIIQVLKVGLGKAFYYGSRGDTDLPQVGIEIHVVDPLDAKNGANGSVDPTTVEPAVIKLVEEAVTTYLPSSEGQSVNAAYDYVTNRLYILQQRGEIGPSNVRPSWIHVLQVNT